MNQQEFLQRYKYDRSRNRIGSGGFGSVYKVFDTLENEYVALKIAEVNPMNESLSLLKEVELASSLARHVNIGKYTHCYRFDTPTGIYDFGILQYYPEGNLSQLIRNHKLTPEEKEHIALGIVNGLQHLHNHNIIHRDLKSANILIAKGYGGEYVPKIADFGLSKQFAENDKSYFSNSFAGGSLHYVAPEQLEGKELRKNVDLWSLGVVLYELFVGETPFKASVDDGSETARAEIIKNIRNAVIPSTIGKVPLPWKDIIRNCLVPDPSKRIKTIEEIQQKLIINNRKENFENDKTELEKKIDNRDLEEKIVEKDGKGTQNQIDKTPNDKNNWSILAWILVLASFFYIGNVIWKASFNKGEIKKINIKNETNEVKTQSEKDERAWQKALNSNIKSGYNAYLYSFPEGKYAIEARRKILDFDQNGKQIKSKNSSQPINKPYIKMISIPGRKFMLSETEVTIGQYLAFCKATDSHWPAWLEKGNQYNIYTGRNDLYKKVGMSESNTNLPITGVSALDADAFCKWMGGRLPTEAEWEYAAKGGEAYEYSGSNYLNKVGWYYGNSGGKVHSVKLLNANGYDLYDMSGNVWEWTSGKIGSRQVASGGSFSFLAQACRVIDRLFTTPSDRFDYIGFRLAISQ